MRFYLTKMFGKTRRKWFTYMEKHFTWRCKPKTIVHFVFFKNFLDFTLRLVVVLRFNECTFKILVGLLIREV